MALISIKQPLDSLGYYTRNNSTYLTVARKVSDDDPMIINSEDFFCRVYLEGTQLRLADFRAQIPDDKFFDSESQVIAFIKKQYPL
jgi:hypothetical protein